MNSSHPGDVNLVDVLRFIWKLRWAALIGSTFALIIATMAFQFTKSPVSSFLIVIDKDSLPAMTDPRDTVGKFNAIFGSSEVSQNVLEDFLESEPDYKAMLESRNYKIHELLQGQAVPGGGPIAIELGNNPSDFMMTVVFPFITTRLDWMTAFLSIINAEIERNNASTRSQVQQSSSQMLENIVIADGSSLEKRASIQRNTYKRMLELKVRLWSSIFYLQSLNLGSSSLPSVMGKTSSSENFAFSASDAMVELVLYELARASYDRKVSESEAKIIQKGIIEIRVELNHIEMSELIYGRSYEQISLVMRKLESSLMRGIDPRLNAIPSFKVNSQMSEWKETFSDGKSSKILVYFLSSAVIAGAILASVGWIIIVFLHANWSTIAVPSRVSFRRKKIPTIPR